MRARRTLIASMAGLALAAATLPAAGAELPTADEVFARHRAAIGGDAIDKVKNAVSEFTFNLSSMGVSASGKIYQVFPNDFYLVIDLAAMGVPIHEEGVTKGIAWRNSPQTGLQKLEGMERRLALQRTRLDGFSGWKELWKKAETVAEEPVRGEPCYKVVLTPEDGPAVTGWFSKKSGLLLEMETPVPQMNTSMVTSLSDYRPIDGVMVPHHVEQAGMMSMVLDYTNVRFNVDDIPPGRFDLPAGLVTPAPAPAAPAP